MDRRVQEKYSKLVARTKTFLRLPANLTFVEFVGFVVCVRGRRASQLLSYLLSEEGSYTVIKFQAAD
jgi:hypothetical protein